ncbi:hypothetical protein AAY473_033225 [Plecturocebus cupreus]
MPVIPPTEENCLNWDLGGKGCSEPRLHDCTPNCATERDSISKQNKLLGATESLSPRMECRAHCSLHLLSSSNSPASVSHTPPWPANFCNFRRDEVLPCWPGWSPTPDLRTSGGEMRKGSTSPHAAGDTGAEWSASLEHRRVRAASARDPRPSPELFPTRFGSRAPAYKEGGCAGGSGRTRAGDAPPDSAGTPRRRPPAPPLLRPRSSPDPRGFSLAPLRAPHQFSRLPLGPRPWSVSPQPTLRPPLTRRLVPPEPPPPPGLGPSRRPPPHVLCVAIAFAFTLASPPPLPTLPPSPQSPAKAEAAPAAAAAVASRSRRRDPREGACALRAAVGAGASHRGRGAGGAPHVALWWEGAPRNARETALPPTFRGGVRARSRIVPDAAEARRAW